MLKKVPYWLLIYCFCMVRAADVPTYEKGMISIMFAHNVVGKQPSQMVCIFPVLKDTIEAFIKAGNMETFLNGDIDLRNNLHNLPLEHVSEDIFKIWILFAESMKVKTGSVTYTFPKEFPIPLIRTINSFIKDNITIDNCSEFINAGDFLGVPDPLMRLVCKGIFEQLVNEKVTDDRYFNNISVNNIITTTYCADLLIPIKDILLTQSRLFHIQKAGRIPLEKEEPINKKMCFFSKRQDYFVYVDQEDVRGNVYYACKIDFITKEAKKTRLNYVRDNTVKNRKLIFSHAAHAPGFLTIVPHDKYLILNRSMYSQNEQKVIEESSKIDLKLDDRKRVESAALSADGQYVIVTYTIIPLNEDITQSMWFSINRQTCYAIYDAYTGVEINSIIMKYNYDVPPHTTCHPTDTTTAIFEVAETSQQMVPMIENNRIKTMYATAETFFEGRQYRYSFYSDSGEYIFLSARKRVNKVSDTNEMSLLRFSSLNISAPATETSVDISNGSHIKEYCTNYQGDFAAYVLRGGFADKLFVIDYTTNTVEFVEENISEGAVVFDGYVLCYIKKNAAASVFVLYDVLHRKQIAQYEILESSPYILGVTQRHELVLVAPGYAADEEKDIILFYDLFKKECEAMQNHIDNFSFLHDNANWFHSLLLLHKSIKEKRYDSTQEWFDTIAHIFSEEFKKILMQCGFSKPTPVGVQPINLRDGITQKRLDYQKKLHERLIEVDQEQQQQKKRKQQQEKRIQESRTQFNEKQSRWQLENRLSLSTAQQPLVRQPVEPQKTWWQRLKIKAALKSRRAYASLMALFK